MIAACSSQLRVTAMAGAFGLDFGAVMIMGAARGADLTLLAEVLPTVEAAILIGRDGAELDLEGGGDE